jgi:type VI secretion system protein ImpJ
MSGLKLAFQRWERGQVLLPEHFRAQEDAIAAHSLLVTRLRGLPSYGIGQLVWSPRDLERGKLVISELTVVFPGGRLVDVPGNAGVTNLDVTKLTPPARELTLYLHLMRAPGETQRTAPYDDDAPEVTRVLSRLRLSTESGMDDALDVLPICVLQLDKPGGTWRVSEGYVPPLLQVGNNPFLRGRLDEARRISTTVEEHLEAQLEDPLFRGERMVAARRCQVGAARLRMLLEEYEESIHVHPYVVFDALRAYDFELAALYEAPPEAVRYEHDDLAGCFDRVLRQLREKSGGEAVSSPSLVFGHDADDRPHVARPFADELVHASEVFLVADRVDADRASFDGVKLATPGHLDDVIRRSLPGVPLKPVPSPPPFRHTFGPQVDFYRLDTRCDEWRRAVDARALAYRATPSLKRVWTALFWRSQ